MKKAVVVGGSSGIGLSMSKVLTAHGYFVEIVSRNPPKERDIDTAQTQHYSSDLRYFDEELFDRLSRDPEVEMLFLSAGVGRIADFENFHIAEVDKTFEVDTISAIKIIKLFYHRIKNSNDFYCGVMGSIAGLINSPLFSVYAAAKAGICRFTESINIELEAAGINNRILEVSPGKVEGTGFYGGQNNSLMNGELAEEILKRMLGRGTRFIPQYEEVYKNVIDRNAQNPHLFGMESYRYKMESGRVRTDRGVVIGYLSGTFDLFHIGHLNLIQRAKQQCDYLIVGVHDSGKWKGKETYIPFDERKRIIGACRYVDKVVNSCVEDSDAWELWHFDKLFVGSDYKGTERFKRYEEFFRDKGVEIVYFPYTQSTSSTQLRAAIKSNSKNGANA